MKQTATRTRLSFQGEWDEIDDLYMKILHWFYDRGDRRKALPYCYRLQMLLETTPDAREGDSKLPHHTSMTYFRERVGAEAIQKIFDEVVAQARRLGLVRDHLRFKDATHVTVHPRASGLRLGSGGGDQCRGLRGSARRRTVAATRRALVRNE